jgi:hypothetical protein
LENNKEQIMLSSKTPEQYIDNSLRVKISSGRKAYLCKVWLQKTGYTVEDIQYARNRHPHWKELKHKGHNERTQARLEKYKFNVVSKKWTYKEIQKFLQMNDTKHDYEIAEYFKRSIPSVQYLRRKIKLLLEVYAQKFKASKDKARMLIEADEKSLRNLKLGKAEKKTGGKKKSSANKKM